MLALQISERYVFVKILIINTGIGLRSIIQIHKNEKLSKFFLQLSEGMKKKLYHLLYLRNSFSLLE